MSAGPYQALDAAEADANPADTPTNAKAPSKVAQPDVPIDPNTKLPQSTYRVEQLALASLKEVLRAYARPSLAYPEALIVDPFAGTGTTAVAAYLLDCDFVGGDTCPFSEVSLS